MRSKANIKGHPLHPILVSFPIAFFMGAFITDLVFITTGNPALGKFATYLEGAGIISALVAAVPGIIDYYATVPPQSSAKERATKHGILNVSMLLIFTVVFFIRHDARINFLIILLLEAAGITFLTIAGWLGGTLVHRNQIGIDHRYAEAGKWNEETIEEKDVVELKELHKLKVGQMKLLKMGKQRIVIARTKTEYVAFDDFCTHRGGSLADGVLICGTVQCPWHGSQFNVKDGSVSAGPAKKEIKTYRISEESKKHYLMIE